MWSSISNRLPPKRIDLNFQLPTAFETNAQNAGYFRSCGWCFWTTGVLFGTSLAGAVGMSAEITHAESIGDLLRGILQDFRTLIREEVALVRVEIGQRVTRARAAAMS